MFLGVAENGPHNGSVLLADKKCTAPTKVSSDKQCSVGRFDVDTF